MSGKGTILILASRAENAAAIQGALEDAGFETLLVARAPEAVLKLRERTFDLLIADAAQEKPSAVEFLAKAREFFPQIPRALYETPGAPPADLRALINLAAPAGVFNGEADAALAEGIIQSARRAAAPAASAAPAGPPASAAPAPKTSAHDALAAIRSAAPPRKEPAGVTAASFGGVVLPMSAPPVPKPSPSVAADASPSDLYPLDSTAYANTKLEFDHMAPDETAELIRVVDLLFDLPDIKLPVLPHVANDVRKLLANADATFDQIANVVSMDPGMSARILEIANSPLYAGVERIKNLQQAVSRIGMRETRNILLAVSAENLFAAADKRLVSLMARLWLHSLGCAYSNEIMAKNLFIEESKDFFMMGLLHDIGKILILQLVQQAIDRKILTKKVVSDEAIEILFARRHNVLGARLMQKWGYDKAFQDVVYLHDDNVNKVRFYQEPVVVTFFSNLMTRKLGFSLLPYPESDPLQHHEVAQALNMDTAAREKIEANLRETLDKVKASFMRPS